MPSVVLETIETQAHRIIDKNDGIIRVYSKPSHIEKEDVQALFDAFQKLCGEEKLIILMDPTEENSMTSEARNFVMQHMKDHVAIFALVGRKKFTRSLFTILSSFVDIGVQMKMFASEKEAETWLKDMM